MSADSLVFEGISKRFGDHQALHHIDLEVRKGEFLCLLGPSGCGKTTLLRILAGLEAQDRGRISFLGRDLTRLPPGRRDYGIVFQSYALFPNLTVEDNIAYGLRTERSARRARVRELLDLVGLPGSEARFPSELSGGQQQRVALARALATSPSLLLLDEPLSALDAQVREHLRQELKSLQHRLGVTTLMVTHDQEEALALADRIAVMRAGRIEQVGRPETIYRHPLNRFVAGFVGRGNWLPVSYDADGVPVLAGRRVEPHAGAENPARPRGDKLFCRPEDVRLGGDLAEGWLAEVLHIEFLGGVRRATLALCADRTVHVQADLGPQDPLTRTLAPGQRMVLQLPERTLPLFAAEAA